MLRQLEASDAKNEEDDDDSDADSVLSDDDDLNEQAKRVLTVKNKLETMDAILDLLFSIYDPIFEDPESPEATEAFQDLLSDFSNVILPVCTLSRLEGMWRLTDRAASQVTPHSIPTLQICHEVSAAHGDVHRDTIQSCVSLLS